MLLSIPNGSISAFAKVLLPQKLHPHPHQSRCEATHTQVLRAGSDGYRPGAATAAGPGLIEIWGPHLVKGDEVVADVWAVMQGMHAGASHGRVPTIPTRCLDVLQADASAQASPDPRPRSSDVLCLCFQTATRACSNPLLFIWLHEQALLQHTASADS